MKGRRNGRVRAKYLFKLVIFLNIESNLNKNNMSKKDENKQSPDQRKPVSKGSTIDGTGGSRRKAVSKGSSIDRRGGS